MNLILRNRTPLPASLNRAAIDNSFERLMQGLFEADRTPTESSAQNLAIDVRETANAYEVEAALPGLRKDEVKISIDAGRVTIAAESVQKRANVEGEKLIHAERTAGKYSRTFSLAADLDEAGIAARLENGILTLTLPKKPLVQAKQIVVQ